MVSQVGLNTSVNMALPALNGNNAAVNTNGSIFTNYNSVPTNDYSNDIFMKNMNFGQIAQVLTPPAAQQNVQPQQLQQAQQAFQGKQNEQAANPAVQEAEQEEPKTSVWGKIAGATVGLLAPIAPKVVKLFRGGKFTELFKKKELLVSCPIFAVVGLGIGMLVDSCVSSRKAQKAEQDQQAKQQEIIRNFVKQ